MRIGPHQIPSNFAAAKVPQRRFLRSPATRWRGAALALLAFVFLNATNNAWGVIVPPGPHDFDTNLPGIGFVRYNGTSFTTTGSVSTDTMGVSIDLGALQQNYPGSSFHIDSGFTVTSTFVFDSVVVNGAPDPGEAIFSSVDSGAFHISNGIGIIISGTFDNATFTSAVGATAGSLSSSNANNLVLTPGPAFTFDTSYVSAIAPSPTGFSISLSSIPGGVAVGTPTGPGPFIPAPLLLFALSNGSTVVSGDMTVIEVPEPASISLVGYTLAALAIPAFRRWRRKA